MRRTTALLLAATLQAPAWAADSYSIDAVHTHPMFEVNHLGYSLQRGRFDRSAGKISLDVAAKTGSVELNIEAGSINMGSADWDKHMKADDFFWVERYPSINYKSERLIFEGERVVAAEGMFTLLGVTRPLRLTVSNFRCAMHIMLRKQVCGAEVTATLKRSDYGMNSYVPLVSDEIKIVSPIEAIKD